MGNYQTLQGGNNFTITSNPSLSWQSTELENVSYSNPDYDSGATHTYNAKIFYTTITSAGTYTIDFNDLYYYITTEQNVNLLIIGYKFLLLKIFLPFKKLILT